MIKVSAKIASGFTLIELLVVISVIGILAALLLANFAGMRDRASDATAKSNLKQLQSALRLRYNDQGSYPATLAAADVSGYADGDLFTKLSTATGWTYAGSGDTFWACVQLTNPNDREKETLGVTGKCPDTLSPSTNAFFCVCAN